MVVRACGARVVDMEELGKSRGGRVVQLWASPQWETQALEAQEAGAVAVVLVRERRWRNRQYWETEQPDYDEDRVVGTAKVRPHHLCLSASSAPCLVAHAPWSSRASGDHPCPPGVADGAARVRLLRVAVLWPA